MPDWVEAACAASGCVVRQLPDPAALLDAVRRGRPPLVVVGAAPRDDDGAASALLHALKADSFTAVVPCLVAGAAGDLVEWLDAGADEVVATEVHPAVARARVAALLRRSVRDLAAQPTTSLPAARGIDAEVERRIANGERFAACYADLDHFKEYNDRYGFREGDRVIRLVARVLHDVAAGVAGAEGFVGHIGGDDFMLVVPLARAVEVCELAIETFDLLAPYQYSEADRRAGYYFGKDRRGQLHRVPLMTLSIGVVTNERRRLGSPAEVARVASEMKSFAKARTGSNFAVDQRGDDTPPVRPRGRAASSSPPTRSSP